MTVVLLSWGDESFGEDDREKGRDDRHFALSLIRASYSHLHSINDFDVYARTESVSYIGDDVIPESDVFWRAVLDRESERFIYFRADEEIPDGAAVRGNFGGGRLREIGVALDGSIASRLVVGSGGVSKVSVNDFDSALTRMQAPQASSIGLGRYPASLFESQAIHERAVSVISGAQKVQVLQHDESTILADSEFNDVRVRHHWVYSSEFLCPLSYRVLQSRSAQELRVIHEQEIFWEASKRYGHVPSRITYESRVRKKFEKDGETEYRKGVRTTNTDFLWIEEPKTMKTFEEVFTTGLTESIVRDEVRKVRLRFDELEN